MSGKVSRAKVIAILVMVVVFLMLYAFYKVNEGRLQSVYYAEQEAERALKYREETRSTLKTELKVVNTKGYVQRQARLDGFLMPSDLHFVFDEFGNMAQAEGPAVTAEPTN